jgi:hypothetical protein
VSRWPGDVARWGRGLFAIERNPLAVRLAVRGTLGLLVPLAAGQVLSWPSLNVVALAAFLLAFGDLTEDRGWLACLATGSVLGALAVATGVLAGAHPVTATLAMLAWGMVLGVAGVYGDGAAAMGLPVAWVFLEIGLPAPDRGIGQAVERGALFLGGGAWAVALAWATRLIRHERPLAERTARCFAVLAEYLAHTGDGAAAAPVSAAPGYRPSAETCVRSAIADARTLAVDTRRRQAAANRVVQRLVALIELADRIFSLASLLAEIRLQRAAAGRPTGTAAAGDISGAIGPSALASEAPGSSPLVQGARTVARVITDAPTPWRWRAWPPPWSTRARHRRRASPRMLARTRPARHRVRPSPPRRWTSAPASIARSRRPSPTRSASPPATRFPRSSRRRPGRSLPAAPDPSSGSWRRCRRSSTGARSSRDTRSASALSPRRAWRSTRPSLRRSATGSP